jgi:hypothetical protein
VNIYLIKENKTQRKVKGGKQEHEDFWVKSAVGKALD